MVLRTSWRRSLPLLALLTALIALVVAFGVNRPGAHAQSSSSSQDGTYTATIGGLNDATNGGTVSGTVTAVISGGTVTVTVNASGLQPSIAHAMHFHSAHACPTAASDVNNDGVIDVVEGVPSYGGILIPIDSDLANTTPGQGTFPMSDASGNLHFTTSAPLSDLVASLHEATNPASPSFVKLTADQTIDLAMRTFVIHGVSDSTSLPSTAKSIPENPDVQATLPVGCGVVSATSTTTPTPTTTATPTPTQTPPEQGTYTAVLGALNTSSNGGTAVTGTVTTTISGDTITVVVDAHGLAPGIMHAMHFHTGDACPDASADTNHNGNIDVVEGVPAYGPILIPIDSNLANTDPNQGTFPTADANGNIKFTTTASLSALMASLHEADANPNDAFAKLTANQQLDILTRHVVVHGVAANTTLPSNTGTLTATGEPHANGSDASDLPPQATLPVACGQVVAGNGAGQTVTITLQGPWTLVGWVGTDNISVADALKGSGGANDITSKVSVVWGYDAATQTWHGYFPQATSVPGANDLTNVHTGLGYFVGLVDPSTPVQWTMQFEMTGSTTNS